MMSRRSLAVLYAIFGLSVLFVTPAWANHIDSANATMTCSTFSLTVSASALTPGTSYEIDFTINASPGATGFPITGSIPFTATSSTFSDTVTGSFTPLVGTFTFSGTASLVGQNTIDISFSPSTLTCSTLNGRFTGGGKLVTADGLKVTLGFELDCDLHQPSNNLEINWLGNQFHMTAFTAAICTLQAPPNPPTAPVNTMIGTGTGRYNGVDGFTVQFTLVDNGEPGTNDEVAILIFDPANPTPPVLAVPLQVITGGNVQAHVDQQ